MDSLLQTNSDIDNTHIAQALYCEPEDCHTHILTSNHLTILTQNIRSIYKNIDAFIVTLKSLKFDCDVLVMTECHLSYNKSVPPLSNNYNTHYTKNNINQCDGVTCYIKKNLVYTVSEPPIKNASCLPVTLKDTVIIGIYRTPSIRNTDEFISSLQSLLYKYKKFKNIILTGDINIDIKFNTNDTNCDNYLTTLAYHGLLPAHRLPTRDKMCYDHIMLKSTFSAKSVVLSNAPTDHSTVILNLMLNYARISMHKTKISHNYPAILQEIKCNLTEILNITDPSIAAETLVTRFTSAINNNKTIIVIPNRKRCIQPWITPGVLRCIRNRDKLHIKVKKNPHDKILKLTYTRYRNYCQKLVRKLKNNYESIKLDNASNSPKQLWKTIKSICHTNNDKNNATHKLATIKATPLESANYINNHFSNAGKKLAEKIIIPSQSPTNNFSQNTIPP
ncbi:uncharacterized protein [Epargyreus clarus]|uniref:uncharacterized protein n=1 Tax=Epargyreus clarus TaxID=520877 RepID=UPI003C2C68FD